MRFWVGVASAFGAGLGIGAALGVILTEDKVRAEYEESARSLRRAMEMAGEIDAEAPAKTEQELETSQTTFVGGDIEYRSTEEGRAVVDGAEVNVGGVTAKPAIAETNPYHQAVEVTPTQTELFVEGGVNDYSISYIEEEEFDEEDGRTKYHVTYFIDDSQQPIFTMNGENLADWETRLGDSIVVDFYRLIPPGAPDTLYVRNHKSDEDYEVTFGVP